MSLYIAQGRGRGAFQKIWNPGDPGQPNQADSKDDLFSFCPQPDLLPCPAEACDQMRYVSAHREARGDRPGFGRWYWRRLGICRRCQDLRTHHRLTLTGLIAIWEAQDRRCFKCATPLPDPRIIVAGVRGKGRAAKIDHDHTICPRASHSCERCRRGLACNACNCHDLSINSRGMWLLPAGDNLYQWLEFLGPADRDRLRKALTLFPEQPAPKASRQRSRKDAAVIPLFGEDAC